MEGAEPWWGEGAVPEGSGQGRCLEDGGPCLQEADQVPWTSDPPPQPMQAWKVFAKAQG